MRSRRLLVTLLVLVSAVAAVAVYRERRLRRSCAEFLERYGE